MAYGGRRSPVVLLYHRIAENGPDPWALAVSPEHFAEQLDVIEKQCPMSVLDLATTIRHGHLPDHAVAISFDDGYASNLGSALPALEARGLPATFFIPSENVGATVEFWWDELERILLGPHPLPAKLAIEIAEEVFEWHLDASRHLRAPEICAADRWKALADAPSNRAPRSLSGPLAALS